MYIIFSKFIKNKYIDNKILIKVILNICLNLIIIFYIFSSTQIKKTLEISTITLEYSISILDQN